MSSTAEKGKKDDLELGSANLINLIFKNRKIIIIICGIAAIASAAASLMIKEKFKSTAIMYAAEDPILGLLITDWQVHQNIMKSGDKEDTEKLVQLLKSDEVRDRVIEGFDLYRHYGISRDEKEAKSKINNEYAENVSIDITRYGSVQVEVMDVSPDIAAKMVNKIAALADTVDIKMRLERSMKAMELSKAELLKLQNEIVLNEDTMAFLREKGLYDYYSQVETLNEEYATAIRKGFNDRAKTLRNELDSISKWGHVYNRISKRIERLYGSEDNLKHRIDQFTIDMNNDVPVKFMIDEGKVADKKSYPIRWLIVVMSVAAAFFLTLVLILILDNIKSSSRI